MYKEEWEQLTDREHEEFARIVNLLFEKTFLVRDEVDTKTRGIVINREFRFLERHYSHFTDYLRKAGWEIQLDGHLGVAALYNRYGHNRRRLDKHTTYLLYTLRLIYEEELEKLTLRREVSTTIGDMVEKMFHLGLVDKKPADKLLREGLSALKSHNIITKLEGSWTNPETRIVIYPSIQFLVTNEKISELYTMLEAGVQGEEEDDETAREDALD